MFVAAVAWEAGKPLVIEEVEVAPPQKMEVRLKILFTSLCHTDVYFWKLRGRRLFFLESLATKLEGTVSESGSFKFSFFIDGNIYPFSRYFLYVRSIVESVGEGVTDLQPGDHVLPVFTGECKECRHCKSEESNMCDLLRINTDRGVMIGDGKSRFSKDGQPIHHSWERPRLASTRSLMLAASPRSIPQLHLTLSVLLAVGFPQAAEGARLAGASRIIGVDLNPSRFEEAKKFGVTEFVNPKDHDKPVQQVLAEMTDGGVDRSVECTGNVNAMISAFECVHDGWGVAVLVGVPNKDDAFKTHPVNVLNERTLKGTFFGNYKPRSDIPSVVEKYMNKELELEKFITHRVPFAEINKAFDYMLRGEGLRCIISMEN
ncbi:UNVERIFIED_CONTAM: Alcohol dehydrogenase 1 [Sesamum radiatum]|uniref:Alcohol dehydrogenase 1 n=1 Tax=Sesamum radiatum TaxID=300843 RepID=A0AAW2M6B6_SESRA